MISSTSRSRLSHWTEPAASQSKNAETSDAHRSAGNGDGTAISALARATPSRFESPVRADEAVQLAYTPWVR